MFLPDILRGRRIALAGPAGPLTEAIADALGRAGAAVALCGQDADALDELAWDLAERRDAVVDIVPWNGADPGDGLRAAVTEAAGVPHALVLLGAEGWTTAAAEAWHRAVVVVPGGPVDPMAGAVVLAAPPETDPAHVAAWIVFLLSGPGAALGRQVVRLDTQNP